jgi:HEPN domain-containing protein
VTPADQARLLATKSDEDIHVLTALRDDLETSDAVWGFHAQQAVEKLLKSLLSVRGIGFPFTHRLLELADLLADGGEALPEQFDGLLDLTPYAVEFRYSLLPRNPNEPRLDRGAILALIGELREYVDSKLR